MASCSQSCSRAQRQRAPTVDEQRLHPAKLRPAPTPDDTRRQHAQDFQSAGCGFESHGAHHPRNFGAPGRRCRPGRFTRLRRSTAHGPPLLSRQPAGVRAGWPHADLSGTRGGATMHPMLVRTARCLACCALAGALLSGCGGGEGGGNADGTRPTPTRSVRSAFSRSHQTDSDPPRRRPTKRNRPTRRSRPTNRSRPSDPVRPRSLSRPTSRRPIALAHRRRPNSCRQSHRVPLSPHTTQSTTTSQGSSDERHRDTRVAVVAAGSARGHRGSRRGRGRRALASQGAVAGGAGAGRWRGGMVRPRAAAETEEVRLPRPGRGRLAGRVSPRRGGGGPAHCCSRHRPPGTSNAHGRRHCATRSAWPVSDWTH